MFSNVIRTSCLWGCCLSEWLFEVEYLLLWGSSLRFTHTDVLCGCEFHLWWSVIEWRLCWYTLWHLLIWHRDVSVQYLLMFHVEHDPDLSLGSNRLLWWTLLFKMSLVGSELEELLSCGEFSWRLLLHHSNSTMSRFFTLVLHDSGLWQVLVHVVDSSCVLANDHPYLFLSKVRRWDPTSVSLLIPI